MSKTDFVMREDSCRNNDWVRLPSAHCLSLIICAHGGDCDFSAVEVVLRKCVFFLRRAPNSE